MIEFNIVDKGRRDYRGSLIMRLFILLMTASALLLVARTASGQSVVTKAKPKASMKKYVPALVGRCAVIIRPDSKKVKLLKKGITDDDYMTLAMDNQYYMGMAIDFLDSVKIRQIEKQSNGILSFKSSSGKYFEVSLNSLDWGILLFNGRTMPINADITNIEEEYRAYMRK